MFSHGGEGWHPSVGMTAAWRRNLIASIPAMAVKQKWRMASSEAF